MIFTVFYHCFMLLVVASLLWFLARQKSASVFLLFELAVAGFLSAVLFGLGNFNLTAHGLAWYGGFFLLASAWIVRRQKINEQHRNGLGVFLLLAGIVWLGFSIDGLLIEPYSITVKRHVIETPNVTEPIRIVFMADFQTDKIGKHERKTLELIKRQNADLILWGGDYLQTRSEEHEKPLQKQFNQLLRDVDLNAPFGIYAVKGNQEFGTWFDWKNSLEGTHVKPMEKTQTINIGEISVTFLSVEASFSTRSLRRIGNPERFRVMVGHAPRFALAKQDADVLLAGHTHGGQIWIPGFGPILTLTKGLPRKWASGMTRLENGSILIVSNGTGMERGRAPRVRLFCRPDIIVIDIKPNLATNDEQ